MLKLNEINLKTLSTIEKLDYRTLRICRRNGLLNLEHIFQYYLNNGNFRLLKLASEHINEKLIAICEKYNSCSLNFDCDNESKVDLEIEDIPDENSCNTLYNDEKITENESITIEFIETLPNYSLEELAQIEDLSVRTITICENYELTDLREILNFYFIEKENFRHLRNCGKNSEEELIKLCEKYKESVYNSSNIHTISNKTEIITDVDYGDYFTSYINEQTLYQLTKNENLSVRLQNICSENGMIDLPSIITYYWASKNFLKLKNCGQKSNLELIELCKKHEIRLKRSMTILLNENTENHIVQKIKALSVKQKSLLLNILKYRFSKLSVRSSNALKAYLESDISIQGVKAILSSPESELRNIRNVGANTISEINDFVNSLKELIETVSNYSNEEDIVVELFNSFLIQKFSLDQIVLTEIRANYDFSNGLPIFKTLYTLIENEILFDHREKEIFKFAFNYYADTDVLTLDQIATKLKLTRERIRQLRLKLFNGLSDSFSFLSEIEINSMNLYGIELDCDYIVIKEDLINEINRNESTNFNVQFILKILSVIVPELFVLIGDEKSVLFNSNVREVYNWQNTYLISKKYTDIFDFEKFINDVSSRLSERIEEDYSFNFQTYLLDFQKGICQNLLESISQITEYMLLNEFELIIDTNENIVFKRNTKKQVIEYVHEVLAERNEPLTVYEIYDLIERKNPGVTKNAEAVRGSCQRDSKLIFFGRTSTYGLKVWENELNIKGGTIRNIAEEFLQNQTEPKHIDEITEYVNIYRNTNSKSIYANLNVDERKRFVFFCGQLVGLSSKEYSIEKYVATNELNIERKSWQNRFYDLQEFAEANNRLPKSISNDKEKVLYRFMNVQLNKVAKSELDNDRTLRIIELVTKYKHHKRKRKVPQDWYANYDDLIKFVADNKRLPKSRIEEEKLLYDFFYRQRKLYQEDNLPLISVEKLLEIAKLLN